MDPASTLRLPALRPQKLRIKLCYPLEPESAIAAEANLIKTSKGSIGLTTMGVLRSSESCKTFDSSATGFARREPVSAIYITSLDHALRDNQPVQAVIRACESNADDRGTGRTFGTPNPVSQEALIRQTYSIAGLDPHETFSIELHGTGTRSAIR